MTTLQLTKGVAASRGEPMKKLLTLLCLFPLLTFAQVAPLSLKAFRGNPIDATVTLTPGDTLLTATALAKYTADGRALPNALQPTVSRAGLVLTLHWNSSDALPELPYVEVKIGAITKLAGYLSVSKRNTTAGPNSYTVTTGNVKFADLLAIPGYLSSTSIATLARSSDVSSATATLNAGIQANATAVAGKASAVSVANNTTAIAANTTALATKIDYVIVTTYTLAVAEATGSLPKRIRVTADPNGYSGTYDYWPDSVATDKLEYIITN